MEKTLIELKQSIGEFHPDYATCLRRLGTIQNEMLQREEAEGKLRRSVELFMKIFGKDDWDTLFAQKELASCIYLQGKSAEAAELLEQVIKDCERLKLKGIIRLAKSRLFNAYADLGRYEEAEAVILSIVRDENSLEFEDLFAVVNYAWLLYEKDEYQRAFALHQYGYEQMRHRFSEGHQMALSGLNGMGLSLFQLKRLEEARIALTRLIKVRNELGGPRNQFHGMIAEVSLGQVLMEMDENEEAKQRFEQVLQEWDKESILWKAGKLTETGMHIVNCKISLAMCEYKLGNTAKSSELFRVASKAGEGFPAHSPLVCKLSRLHSDVLISQGQYEAARTLLKRQISAITGERQFSTSSAGSIYESACEMLLCRKKIRRFGTRLA